MIRPAWIDDGSPIPDPLGCAERNIAWLLRLRHPKSKRSMFALDEWQRRVLRKLYGPRDADGARMVRRLVLLLPRGNRKTSLCAAIMLLHLIGPESVPGDLILSAAGAREQAFELYNEAALIVEHDRRLDSVVRVTRTKSTIECRQRSTVYKAVSADGRMQHGKTPRVIIADELHVWSGLHGHELWAALDSATVKISETLMVIASTAGRGRENIAWKEVEHALKVQKGEIDDPATLPVIFMAEEGDDWRDEALWHALNPGMAFGYPDLPSLRDKARKAEASPSNRGTFLQLNLNRWLDTYASGAFDMANFDAGKIEIDLARLKGRPCWIGVDLAQTEDLTAVVMCFRGDDDDFIVVPYIFTPEDGVAEKALRDKVPYPRWRDEGHIFTTPGWPTNIDLVTDHILTLCGEYDVQVINIDKRFAKSMWPRLMQAGHNVVQFDQGWQTMGPASVDLLRVVGNRKLKHNGNPALRWNFENAVVVASDRNENVALHKGKSRGRIDATVATAMAIAGASQGETFGSMYDDPAFSLEDWSA